jgi:hypothetical protein
VVERANEDEDVIAKDEDQTHESAGAGHGPLEAVDGRSHEEED